MSTAVEQIILKEINAKYPITVNHIEKITNEMYRCSNNFNEYYVRVTDYRSFEEQLEEINWLSYLEQHGVGISPIIKSLQGNLVEKGESFEEKSIVLFGAAKGIHLSRSEWKGDVFKELGRQIGRMHRITSQYEQEHEINHMINWYDNAEYRFLDHIPKEETTIRKLAQKILNEVQLLSKDRHTYGLLHGDLWLENVLVNNHSEITLIDFQDCEKHFYLYDLIVPIYSALEYSFAGGGNRNDYGESITKLLFEGYLEEHTIADEMIEKLPLLFKLKELFEYSLIHMYEDVENAGEELIRVLNHYRYRLENNHPVLNEKFLANLFK